MRDDDEGGVAKCKGKARWFHCLLVHNFSTKSNFPLKLFICICPNGTSVFLRDDDEGGLAKCKGKARWFH